MAAPKAWALDDLVTGAQPREGAPVAAMDPRSQRERQLAVRALLAQHPDWADRRIGILCGVSPRTVGRVRAQAARAAACDPATAPEVRIGLDGRARPIDPAAQRDRIVAALEERPEASLRDIARLVGVSHETVRSVRSALAEKCRLPEPRPVDFAAWRAAHDRAPHWAPDHSFSSHDDAAAAAQFLERSDVSERDLERYAVAVPLSRIYEVSDEARRRAAFWTQLAERVEARAQRRHG